jgi:hypothetical protein
VILTSFLPSVISPDGHIEATTHEAASEDNMLKRGGGVCGSICPWCGGGGWSQLLRQVEEGGPRPCVVNQGARTLKDAWLIEMGARAQSCFVD